MAVVGELCVVSTYFPNSWKGCGPFGRHCIIFSKEIHKAYRAGAEHAVIGCDANVEIEPNFGTISGPSAFAPQLDDQQGNDRRHSLYNLCGTHGLRAANMWLSQADLTTRQPWMRAGRRTQFDYIFLSAEIHIEAGVSNGDRCLDSDHFPVFGNCNVSPRVFFQRTVKPSLKGWQPKTEDY